jgi:hypothetical protein
LLFDTSQYLGSSLCIQQIVYLSGLLAYRYMGVQTP